MMKAIAAPPDAISPAVAAAGTAWKALSGASTTHVWGCVISESEKSVVVRVLGGDGDAIIAKRAARASVQHEAYLYKHLLPLSGVSAPRFFGIVRDGEPSRAWLFIADAAGAEYDPSNKEHAVRAARWLVSVHASFSDAPAEVRHRLPRRDAGTYLAHLRKARMTLRRRLSGTDGHAGDRSTLQRAIGTCDELERRWRQIVDLSRALPPTLVHGDFAPENIRVAGDDVNVFDWEKAGWGSPVVDIARVDLETYCERACALWGMAAADVVRGASCGAIFRTLSHRWAEKPLGDVDRFCHRLAREMRAAGLEEVSR